MLSCIRLDKLLLHLLPLQFNFEPDRKLYFQNICYPFYTFIRFLAMCLPLIRLLIRLLSPRRSVQPIYKMLDVSLSRGKIQFLVHTS